MEPTKQTNNTKIDKYCNDDTENTKQKTLLSILKDLGDILLNAILLQHIIIIDIVSEFIFYFGAEFYDANHESSSMMKLLL